MRRGTRQRNKKAWKGRYRPEGCDDTGKKGAMPEPAMSRGLAGCLSRLMGGKCTSITELTVLLHGGEYLLYAQGVYNCPCINDMNHKSTKEGCIHVFLREIYIEEQSDLHMSSTTWANQEGCVE